MTNRQAQGYAFLAMIASELDPTTIKKVINEMNIEFDLKTEKEAEEYFNLKMPEIRAKAED